MAYTNEERTYGTSAPGPGQGANKAGQSQDNVGPAQKRFDALRSTREPYLIRARRLARLTVPHLYREYGENFTTSETMPWQSAGAYCVNVLAAKLTLVLFPPGIPFIRLKATRKALQDLNALSPDQAGQLKAEIQKGLSQVERDFIDEVEADGDRYRIFDGLRHAVVGGNHALKFKKDSSVESIPFERFVTVRDASQNLMEFIIESPLAWETLDPEVRAICLRNGYRISNSATLQDPVKVYTRGALKDGRWHVCQECYGEDVPGTEAVWNPDVLPYLFIGMVWLKDEPYARSYCEDYEADFQTLDGFWQIITEGAAGIAQLKWLVKPGGVTNKRQFTNLPNGGVMTGDVEDVAAVRSEKGGDLSFSVQMAEKVESRLERAFLVNSSVQRQGERVTAEEIRYMAQELETNMGGVYSNQCVTLQRPYAVLKMNLLQRQGRITPLPKETVRLTIFTGDAGLGRVRDQHDLDEWLETATAALGDPTALRPYVSIGNYLARGAANRGIDPDGLIKSDDQVAQEAQQAQMTQMAHEVAPEAVRQGGQMLQNAQQAAINQSTPEAPPAGAQ